MTDEVPELAELFLRNPLLLTRDDIIASLPSWRQARQRFNLAGKGAPAKEPKALSAKKKLVDLSLLGLEKK